MRLHVSSLLSTASFIHHKGTHYFPNLQIIDKIYCHITSVLFFLYQQSHMPNLQNIASKTTLVIDLISFDNQRLALGGGGG
ncbi:MAG: hypothetical protein IKY31_03900, partial [Bacteroidaceae bacterium]|nr:hypothetical protein [Bacteroidaceae bacterium]